MSYQARSDSDTTEALHDDIVSVIADDDHGQDRDCTKYSAKTGIHPAACKIKNCNIFRRQFSLYI